MHDAVIRLVDRQPGRLLDVASHARVIDAELPGLERSGDAAVHENATRLADRVVHSIDVPFKITGTGSLILL
jgi:hypothetical protein